MTGKKAECRGCGLELTGTDGNAVHGGEARHPETGERCPTNHFGGYVCSRRCDVRACLRQLSSMPGAGEARRLDRYCEESVENNWGAI